MQSSTQQFNKKKSLNNNSRALLLGDFSLLDWKQKVNIIKIPSLKETLDQLKIYPQAKQYLKEQTKICHKINNKLVEVQQYNEDVIYRKANKDNEWFWRDIIESFNNITRKATDTIIKRNTFILENKSDSFPATIEKAKQYPITSLLEFKGGKTLCIFHPDKKPSLYYYEKTNTCYCFSCHTYADSIKVYQQLKQCTFNQSLKALQ
jgi:hypothetical protein